MSVAEGNQVPSSFLSQGTAALSSGRVQSNKERFHKQAGRQTSPLPLVP
ncbi:hypothetical protein TRIP_B200179 [uncultured Desulfatiglans sp.]|uniref:Uncharacterized protein n=1 Tax=Uncultured Desulfatiglans sp. TaxID=1748965 RepID=A0A653A1Y5_UNCDX|nr:hypothetical protein TRIP_B200179 [uncultured Desulfatiglans sp.]